MSRIFLSHSSRNDASAVALRDWLSAQGWDDVFLDLDPQRGIAAGERWERSLNQAALRCEAVLFLVSRSWLESDWCQKEFNLAHRLNKRLFGLLIEDIPVNELPVTLTGTWQLVPLASGRDHIMLQAKLPHTQDEVHVTFSKEGMARLRIGLERAGLDPKFFRWPPENDPKRSPYRGLLPLEASDAGIFFGRDAPTIEALDRIRGMCDGTAPRILVLLGASGTGKSSFLRAGLLPRLVRDDRNYLPLLPIRPERAAISGEAGLLRALETAFAEHGVVISRAELRKAIEDGAAALRPLLQSLITRVRAALVADVAIAKAPVLVLAIDQGEELFLTEGASESAVLLNLLGDLLADDAPAMLVVVTIRSDTYEHLQTAKAFEGMVQQTMSLTPMPRGAYQAIIEGPATRLREAERPLIVEPALTQALLSDIEDGGGRDALPLLAFTLERLYLEYGGRSRLTLRDYDSLGRITGSIEAAVERALIEADNDQRIPTDRNARLELLRRGLIPWLASVDSDTGSPRRQKALASEIPKEARPLIDLLIEQRLLSTDLADDTRERTIEPAHESLLRLWSSLRDWLKEDFTALSNLETLKRAARDWAANARGEDWLSHRASRLEEAERVLLRPDLAGKLDDIDAAYLAACRSREKAAQLTLARQIRRQRRLSIAAVAAAAIMTAVGAIAYWQKTKADAAIARANVEIVRATESEANAQKQRDIAERKTAEATRHALRAEARAELLRSQMTVKDNPKEAISRAYEASLKMKSLGAEDEAVSPLNAVLKSAREVPFRSPYSHYRMNLGTGFITQPDAFDIAAPQRQNPLTIFASRDFTGVVDDSGSAVSKPLGSGDASGSLVNAAAWLDDNHFILATGAWTREDGARGEQAPWNSAIRSYSSDGTLDRVYLDGHRAVLLSVAALRSGEKNAVLAGDESGNLIIASGSDAPVVAPTGIAGPLRNIIVLKNYREAISLVLIFGHRPYRQGQDQDSSRNIEAISKSLSSLFNVPVHISYLGDQQTDDDSCAVVFGYELFVCDGAAVSVWRERSDLDLAEADKSLSRRDVVWSSDQRLERSRRFMTHSGPVTAIALSPQSPIIVTGSRTGEIRAWLADGRLLDEIATGTGEVDALGFSNNGSLLLGSASGAYRAWDISDLARQWHTLHRGDRAEGLRLTNWVRFFDPNSRGLKSPKLAQLEALIPEGSYSDPVYAGRERFLVAEHSWGLRIFDSLTSATRDVRLTALPNVPDNNFKPMARVAQGGNDTICVLLPNRHILYAINAETASTVAEWSLPRQLDDDASVVAHVRNGRATCWMTAGSSVQEYSPLDKSVTSFSIANNVNTITGLSIPDESDTIVLITTNKGVLNSSAILIGRIVAPPDKEARSALQITASVKINGVVSRLAVSPRGSRIAIPIGEDSVSEVRVFDHDLNIVTTLPGSPEHFIDLQFNKDGTQLRGLSGTFSMPEFAYEQNLELEVLMTTAQRRIEAWKHAHEKTTLYNAVTKEKNREKLRGILIDALSQYPSDAIFKRMLAENEYSSGKGADTKARGLLLYDDSVVLDKFNPIAHYMRGRARASLGDHRGAIEDFTDAIGLPHILPQVRIVPGPPDINAGIAALSYTLNVKNAAELHLRRANSLAEIGDWQGVIQDVAWLRRLSTADALAYELEGLAFENAGDAKRAVDSFKAALDRFRSDNGYGVKDLNGEEKLVSWGQFKLADYKKHLADNYLALGQEADSAATRAEAKTLISNAYASSDLTAETRKRLDRLSEAISK